MYFPFLRGKQYELTLVREQAPLLAKAKFIPIIEPVRNNLKPLTNSLDAVVKAGGEAIVIINPHHGEHGPHRSDISTLLTTRYSSGCITPGVLLTNTLSASSALSSVNRHLTSEITLIHRGFQDATNFVSGISPLSKIGRHVFIGDNHSMTYCSNFSGGTKVLVRSNFNKTDNSKYPKTEFFSDLHHRFGSLGYDGFGDFLTVADEYSDTGGPPWAVTIHLTFIDRANGSDMKIHHFVSTTRDTNTNAPRKFREAVRDLVKELDRPHNQIREFAAAASFRDLNARSHFPNLGFIKKLSMQHHIETLADYFDPPIG